MKIIYTKEDRGPSESKSAVPIGSTRFFMTNSINTERIF